MFKIGNVEIKNRIVLAPMAGICNSAFRKIIKEMGVGLIYAEMVSDKALVYASKICFICKNVKDQLPNKYLEVIKKLLLKQQN